MTTINGTNNIQPWTSEELEPLLEGIKWITEPKERKALSKIIARLSMDILEHPNRYNKDQGVRIPKSKVQYIDENTRKEYRLPRTLWVKLRDDGKSFRVQVYGPEIRRGRYKVVKESETLKFSLLPGIEREIKKKETVLVRSLEHKPFEEDSSDSEGSEEEYCDELERISEPLEEIQSLFTSKERKEFNIGGVPKLIRKYKGKSGYKLEWEDTRYLANFDEASESGTVNINGSGKFMKVRMNDKCRILESVIRSLRSMHEKGIVHRDVKPMNILLRFHPIAKRLESVIIDYDFISNFGGGNTPHPYTFWDRCSERGIVFPTTDLFGVAMSLACSVFGYDLIGKLVLARKAGDYAQIQKLINDKCRDCVQKMIQLPLRMVKGPEQRKRIEMFPQKIQEAKSKKTPEKSKSNFDEVKEEVDGIASAHPDSKALIRECLADCYALHSVSKLLWDMYQEDKKLFDFMTGTLEGVGICRFFAKKGTSLEEEKKKLQEIYKRFPLFEGLEGRIRSIREEWEALSDVDGFHGLIP